MVGELDFQGNGCQTGKRRPYRGYLGWEGMVKRKIWKKDIQG